MNPVLVREVCEYAKLNPVTLKWIGDTLRNFCDFNHVSYEVTLEIRISKDVYDDGGGELLINCRTFAFGTIYYRAKIDEGEKINFSGTIEIEGHIDDLYQTGFHGLLADLSKVPDDD